MLEAGQYYGQQTHYPDWQAAGVARGNGPVTAISRGEAVRLYEINLAAFHESLRRRERHMWFFTAVNFALGAGVVLMVALTATPMLVKLCSLLALAVGVPVCLAWRRALDKSREEHDLTLGMVRKLEEELGVRHSPLGEDVKPDPYAQRSEIGRERFLPRMLLWSYLGLAAYVWQVELYAMGDWCLTTVLGLYDNMTATRR